MAGRLRTMRKLTPMQLDTLTSFYYGEVFIRPAAYQINGTRARLWDMFDVDGACLSSRYQSLLKRRLIRWVRWPSPDQEMVQAIMCTPEGEKEVEAANA